MNRYRAYAKPRPKACSECREKAESKPLVTAIAEGNELFIYDAIDSYADEYWGGISARMVKDALAEVNGDIKVRINSPGGDVYEGITILNLLRDHPGNVTVQVDGLAASAASFIAMAGDTVNMMPNSEIMIHDALMMTYGNADELRADAVRLDKVSDNIADAYAARAGGKQSRWRDLMRAETWYSASEAVKAGLADSVVDVKAGRGKTAASLIGNAWELPYSTRYASRRDAPAPEIVPVAAIVAPEPSADQAFLAAFIERETACP